METKHVFLTSLRLGKRFIYCEVLRDHRKKKILLPWRSLLLTALSWYCGLSFCFPHADQFPFLFPGYALFLPSFRHSPGSLWPGAVYLVFRMCLFAYLESSVQCLSPFVTERVTHAGCNFYNSQPPLTHVDVPDELGGESFRQAGHRGLAFLQEDSETRQCT